MENEVTDTAAKAVDFMSPDNLMNLASVARQSAKC